MLRSLICLALFASAVHAQTASVTGRVTDASGAVVPGADIAAKSAATNAMVSTSTNSDGYYSISNLVPGTYDVTVSKPGFASVEAKGLQLQVEQVARQPRSSSCPTMAELRRLESKVGSHILTEIL